MIIINILSYFFSLRFTGINPEKMGPGLNIWEPHKAPIFVANNFAFWKKFAESWGYLDVDTEIWAGDDTEFSLKAWVGFDKNSKKFKHYLIMQETFWRFFLNIWSRSDFKGL